MLKLTAWFSDVISYASMSTSESLEEIGVLAENCPDAGACSELIEVMKAVSVNKQFNANLKTLATSNLKDLYPNIELLSPGRIPRPDSVGSNPF
ncbi:MAG: hypothetical protein JSS32_05710 [Verrucomicrobia bacterium]|nr:hypothetical protein [Verrucomicrobiota bacterium]